MHRAGPLTKRWHTGDALLGIAAQGGQGLLAGQALQWAAGETLTVGSGGDTNMAVNQSLRVHSGQGISWLAGANGTSGASETGLSVIWVKTTWICRRNTARWHCAPRMI